MISSSYILFMLPAFVLALMASLLVQSTFRKYARTRASSGLTGAEAAALLLRSEGVTNVRIERTGGWLGDHFDPTTNTLRLSGNVYDSTSLSAIGVACHEAGHALQKARRYAPLALRTQLVPMTQLGSNLAFPILLAGLFLHRPGVFKVGLLLFFFVVVFTLVTLPVEWDASRRAKRLMVKAGIVSPGEQARAASVLNAAFLTYVASAVSAVMNLLYYASLARRSD